MSVLFENEYCKIIDVCNIWIRVDKVAKSVMKVESYFNYKGQLVRK